ncbi:type II toxin-antitoxin system prevent-host-death family antitoxin, partial [Candidatus Micrarchaeota archaeon]
MIFVNVRDLHNRTSEILREAASGKPIFITRYGKP